MKFKMFGGQLLINDKSRSSEFLNSPTPGTRQPLLSSFQKILKMTSLVPNVDAATQGTQGATTDVRAFSF
jgi:hypothetical protein